MTIGERIKLKREELNLTQDELALKLGYKSRSTINKIEKGINDLVQSKIVEFANALNTTPAYLMGWDVERVDDGYLVKENGNEYRAILNDITKDVSDEELIEIIKYAKYLLKDHK